MSRYGADRVWVEQHYVHNTGQSNSPRTVQGQQRPQREQPGREASWLRSKLAEGSQEGEKGRGKWKVGDKTQGGRSKTNFEKEKERIKMIGEKKKQKGLITYVDKPTLRVR
jgi:hypothetical protein